MALRSASDREHGKQGLVCQKGRGAAVCVAVCAGRVRPPPPSSQLEKATEAVGIGLGRRPRYGCHSAKSHC